MSINKKTNPMTKSQFNLWLRKWEDETSEKTVGEFGNYGQTPHIYVKDIGRLFHLNADTKRAGVGEYLKFLDSESHLIWEIVPNRNQVLNKVAFGKNKEIIKGFYLYIC